MIPRKEMLNNYRKTLEAIERSIGNDITYNDQLEKYGNIYIPKTNNFLGVYPQDVIPNYTKYSKCCYIINTSPCNKQGEHWIGVWRENNKNYMYDSFGRNPERITPIFNSRVGGQVYYDDEKEQRDEENNCGQRTLSWLLCCCKYGIKNGIKI
jgi:hypothetical protein